MNRDGIVARKLMYEVLTGPPVRGAKLLTVLSEKIGARKASILACAKNRTKMDSDHKLVPFVSRIQRKSPEGNKVISIEWKIRVVEFFESVRCHLGGCQGA